MTIDIQLNTNMQDVRVWIDDKHVGNMLALGRRGQLVILPDSDLNEVIAKMDESDRKTFDEAWWKMHQYVAAARDKFGYYKPARKEKHAKEQECDGTLS